METQLSASRWEDHIASAADAWKGKQPRHIISRICLSATIYYIWQERNNRVFKDVAKPREQLLSNIVCIIRNIIGVAWKQDINVQLYMDRWKGTHIP